MSAFSHFFPPLPSYPSQYNEKGATVDDYLFLNPCPKGSICNNCH